MLAAQVGFDAVPQLVQLGSRSLADSGLSDRIEVRLMCAAIGIVTITVLTMLGLREIWDYLKQRSRDSRRKSFLEHMNLEGGWQAPSRGKLHC